MTKAIIGLLVVAAVSTVNDYVWFEIGVRHRMWVGILTGAVLLMAVGGAVGWTAKKVVAGLWLGVAAGVIGALVYYAMEPSVGGVTAMIAGWALIWIVLALGEGRILQSPRRPWGETMARGVIAAALSGLTFYVVLNGLWSHLAPGSRNYVLQYARWLVAWAPGILAITGPGRRR
jgi:hypothetical protein